MDDPTHRATRRDALIVDALTGIFEMLERAEPSAYTRALRTQARSFEHAVNQWMSVPPPKGQLDAMFELVLELHAIVVEATTGHAAPGS